MSKEAVLDKPATKKEPEIKTILNLSGVLGYELVEKKVDDGTLFEIWKGSKTNKKLVAFFVNDHAWAVNSLYTKYSQTLAAMQEEAKNKISGPATAKAEVDPDGKPMPKFAETQNQG